MKQRYKIIVALLIGVMMLGGCGSKDARQENTSVEITSEMAEEYVTLGDYEGIALTKYITEATEDDIALEKEEFMDEYKIQTEVADSAIAKGNLVNVKLIEVPEDGEAENYGNVDITVGEEEFDAQIDKALPGHKTGEEINVESSYEDEEGQENKVTYKITINKVYEISYPEYNDEFVKKNTEYASVAELEEAFKAQVEADNEENSMDNLREAAIAAVVECSQFKEFPQNLLDAAYEEVKEMYESYAAMFGMELSDMASEEDLKEAAQYSVQEKMVIETIKKQEKLEVDKEGFDEYKKMSMEYAEVENEEELMEYYEEGELEEEYLYRKVADAIIAKAAVTEEESEEEDEYQEENAAQEAEVDENVILEEEPEADQN